MESTDEMARAAGEPSTKRAKVDEAGKEEEEDPLVRRKEEVVRLLEEASAKGEDNARAKEELLTLCADLQAKNEKTFGGCRLPPEMWQKILDEYLHQNDLLAFAMTCRFFREKQKDLGKKMKTDLNCDNLLDLRKSGMVPSRTLGWFWWVCDTFELLPGFKWGSKRVEGAVYEGDLVNYAAFQGSVEILRWLMEEKGWELNRDTDWWGGSGGSVEILEYLEGRGYKFTRAACGGAAKGGRLEALKFLRGLDPPCPWDDEWICTWSAQGGHLDVLKFLRAQDPPCPWHESACSYAAKGGHLEALKFLRSQDPPCPWDEETCAWAARGGHLEVLKFARGQDPPCPWIRSDCRAAALESDHQHVIDWINQQEDEI